MGIALLVIGLLALAGGITLLVILIAKPSTGLGEVLVTINLLNALVWLAINLVNRLRERLVSHRDQH